MRHALPVILLALLVAGCAESSSNVLLPPGGEPDTLVERHNAAELTGTVTLNGASTTSDTYADAPFEAKIGGRSGDLCLISLTPTAIPGAGNNPLVQFKGTTTSYGSLFYPTDNTVQYMPIYLTANEPVGVVLHNSSTAGGPLFSQAVKFAGTIQTIPREDSGEPNDDGNVATITDRTMANTLPVGATFNRSLFRRTTTTNEDREDWYKITLVAGNKYVVNLTNSNGTWGSWSCDLKLMTTGGTTIASRLAITDTSTSIEITATVSASYYLQVVGTPLSRRGGSVYYSPFSIQLLQIPIPVISAVTPGGEFVGAEFLPVTFSATATGAPTSWSWNFAGGATPDTSTVAAPAVSLGPPGVYKGTVTATNAAGTSLPFEFGYRVIAPAPPVWRTMVVATGSVTAPSMKVHNGRIMIAYGNDANDDLFFALGPTTPPLDTNEWLRYPIDTFGEFASELDLGIVNGLPVIAYLEQGIDGGNLRVARATTAAPTAVGQWNKHSANTAAMTGFKPAVIDSNGRIGVFYHDKALLDLRFTRANVTSPTGNGNYVTHSVTTDLSGDSVSLAAAVIGGRPWVVYTRTDGTGQEFIASAGDIAVPLSAADWTERAFIESDQLQCDSASIASNGSHGFAGVSILQGASYAYIIYKVARPDVLFEVTYIGGSGTTYDQNNAPDALAVVGGRPIFALESQSGTFAEVLFRPNAANPTGQSDWDSVQIDPVLATGFRGSIVEYEGRIATSYTTSSGDLRLSRALSFW